MHALAEHNSTMIVYNTYYRWTAIDCSRVFMYCAVLFYVTLYVRICVMTSEVLQPKKR